MIRIPWSTQPPVGTPLDLSHPLCQGLVGCWPMNEGGGVICQDSARNNSAIITGAPAKSLSVYGEGRVYDTTAKYTIAPYSPAYSTLSFTFVAAIRFQDTNAVQGFLFGIRQTSSPFNQQSVYIADGTQSYAAGKKIVAVCGTNTGPAYYDRATPDIRIDTKWHILAVSVSYSIGIIITLDGVNLPLSNIRSVWGNSVPSAPTQLRIGGNVDLNWTPKTDIGFLMRYNRALSEQEIKSLYENPYQIYQPLQYWICPLTGLQMYVDIDGTVKQVQAAYGLVGGAVKQMNPYTNVGGIVKQL